MVEEPGIAAATVTAKAYCGWDFNPATRAATEALLAAAAAGAPGASRALVSAFGASLEFGTAGLRGPMGAGSARMNDVTVVQAAQGLAVYLAAVGGDGAKRAGVVVGHDHRALAAAGLTSHRFALLTAAALASAGFRVYLYEGLVATPLVPFGIRHLGAAAGVMVTASHNPKEDNGCEEGVVCVCVCGGGGRRAVAEGGRRGRGGKGAGQKAAGPLSHA